MEYYYQSDHRRSYRHRRGTWHPILYSLIFNFGLKRLLVGTALVGSYDSQEKG